MVWDHECRELYIGLGVGDVVFIQDYKLTRRPNAPEGIELSMNNQNPTSILCKIDVDSLEPSLRDIILDRASWEKCSAFEATLISCNKRVKDRPIQGKIIYAGPPLRELGKRG